VNETEVFLFMGGWGRAARPEVIGSADLAAFEIHFEPVHRRNPEHARAQRRAGASGAIIFERLDPSARAA